MAIISDAGMDRIIAAGRAESMAYDIDRDGLRGCLALAFGRYRDAVELSSDASENAEVKRLAQISKVAKRLQLLLGPVDIREWARNGSPGPEDVNPTPIQTQFTTTDLVAAIDHRLKNRPKADERYARSFKKYNSFDWMVGVYLADVYEFNFRTPPQISENGPFVRFAEAVLHELKIRKSNGTDYKRASILKSLKTVRAGRTRRRKKTNQQPLPHWSLGQLVRAYRTSSSLFRRDGEGLGPTVTITDYNALVQYLIETRDPGLLAAVLAQADRDIAEGKTPPGVKTIRALEPVRPLEDELGNPE